MADQLNELPAAQAAIANVEAIVQKELEGLGKTGGKEVLAGVASLFSGFLGQIAGQKEHLNWVASHSKQPE